MQNQFGLKKLPEFSAEDQQQARQKPMQWAWQANGSQLEGERCVAMNREARGVVRGIFTVYSTTESTSWECTAASVQ